MRTMSWPWIALVSTRLGFFTIAWVMSGWVEASDGWRNFVFFDRFSSGNDCSASANEPLVDGSPAENGMMSVSA